MKTKAFIESLESLSFAELNVLFLQLTIMMNDKENFMNEDLKLKRG